MPVRANHVGQFLLTKVPPGTFRLIAETEGARVEQATMLRRRDSSNLQFPIALQK